jgi:glutathione S-transferase
MLKIYEMLHSPYCIPITRMLRAAGQEYESVTVPNWDRSAVIELTGGAYYQVPVLVHDGQVVFEQSDSSLVVAHHVDATFCGGQLFPERISGIHELLIDHIESELEGYGFRLCDIHYLPAIADLSNRTAVIRHKERRFGRGCVDQWRRDEKTLRAKFFEALTRFKGTLTSNAFLFGEAPVYADFALAGVLGNYAYPETNSFTELDWLTAWVTRLDDVRF